MCILNLIIKPVTAFLIFRVYRERGGTYSEFHIPGIGNLPSFDRGKTLCCTCSIIGSNRPDMSVRYTPVAM